MGTGRHRLTWFPLGVAGIILTACMPGLAGSAPVPGSAFPDGRSTALAAGRGLMPDVTTRLSQPDGAVASSGDPKPALQGTTGIWTADGLPAWVAMPLTAAAPSTLLITWNAVGYTYLNTENAPIRYTLQVSTDSHDGRDGTWQTVALVRDNAVRARVDTIHAPGARWIKLAIETAGQSHLRLRDLAVYGVAAGSRPDAWFMLGDSITDGSYNALASRDFVETVHRALPTHTPVVIDGGTQGDNSSQGAAKLPNALLLCPPGSFVGIAFGTNDTAQNVPLTTYRQNLQRMIDMVVASGRTPMLPRVPWFPNPKVVDYNTVVDDVVAANHLQPGPDLYAWFQAHPEELGTDQVHPKETGRRSLQRLWGEAVVRAYQSR